MITPDGEVFGPVGVIEIRKAKNGYVVSAITNRCFDDNHGPRGYATYVVESDNPEDVGRAVAKAIQDFTITEDVPVLPARGLP